MGELGVNQLASDPSPPRPSTSTARTSGNSPLRIDVVELASGGLIGMSLCPGKRAPTSISGGAWMRDLQTDIEAIRLWGAGIFVTLMESWELDTYKVAQLGAAVDGAGMTWLHLPIVDGAAPSANWDNAWAVHGAELLRYLHDGNKVFVHCLGGRGRTGTVAVLLLIADGASYDDALACVRKARHGAVETVEQEQYLQRWHPCDKGD